jgi:hypothetical protein
MNLAIYNFADVGLFKLVKFFKNFSKREGGTLLRGGNSNCAKIMTFKMFGKYIDPLVYQLPMAKARCMLHACF